MDILYDSLTRKACRNCFFFRSKCSKNWRFCNLTVPKRANVTVPYRAQNGLEWNKKHFIVGYIWKTWIFTDIQIQEERSSRHWPKSMNFLSVFAVFDNLKWAQIWASLPEWNMSFFFFFYSSAVGLVDDALNTLVCH